MPLSHVSKVFAVSDAKISKITTDATGGAVVYATAIDVPGIKSVGIGGDLINVALRGDNSLLDSNSVLDKITVEFEYAKLSLDALVVWLGGANVDSGTTPNMKATYSLLAADTFSYWKFEARTPTSGVDTIGGDAHIVLYKCILDSFPEMGFAEEDYQILKASATAVPTLGTGLKLFDIILNETQVAIT